MTVAKFKLRSRVTVSAYTEVEADTAQEATAAARDREVELGGPNSGARADESWIIEEADGEAMEIQVDSSQGKRADEVKP